MYDTEYEFTFVNEQLYVCMACTALYDSVLKRANGRYLILYDSHKDQIRFLACIHNHEHVHMYCMMAQKYLQFYQQKQQAIFFLINNQENKAGIFNFAWLWLNIV